MALKTKNLGIDCGRTPVVFLNKNSETVKSEGFRPLIQVRISNEKKSIIGILNFIEGNLLNDSEIGLSKKANEILKPEENENFEIKHMEPLLSFGAIRDKLRGKPFTEEGIFNVIKDVVNGKYTDMHMACLCSATEGEQLSDDEIAYLAKAMTNTGETVKWDYDIVVDKHCIGGIPGNRTTPIAIPIIAEFGLHIPKTSSNAITSASGTAEVMNVLTEVNIDTKSMKKIVDDVNGCVVWGGGVDLNPSDDIIITVKKDLDLDSRGQMLASILSKKIAAGSTHILIDIPYGPSAKTKTLETATSLKRDFETLGKKLGAHVYVNISNGTQPVGRGVGPALEAQDVVDVLQNKTEGLEDLKEKAIHLSGLILEFSPKVKEGEGEKIARKLLESGKAWERFQKICEAQGGMKQIPTAKLQYDVLAKKDGIVYEFDNRKLAYLAKLAGAPLKPAAGVYIYKHLDEKVKKGEKLYTIHADSQGELDLAIQLAKEIEIIKVK